MCFSEPAQPGRQARRDFKKLEVGKRPGAGELAKLAKVKAKLDTGGDYAEMEKVRDLLKELSKP